MVQVTVALLTAIAKAADSRSAPKKAVMQGIVDYWSIADKAGITSINEVSAFLGQGCVETDYFKTLNEYWGPTPTQKRYEGRKGLGNTVPGDGKKFMGRGIFQYTGRSNYKRLSEVFGHDFLQNPKDVATPRWSMEAAVLYWKDNNLAPYAKRGDFVKVGRGINRGDPESPSKANHEAERIRACEAARATLGGKAVIKPKPPVKASVVAEPEFVVDEKIILKVQKLLNDKGWHEVGTIDGKIGNRTNGAILAFRNEQKPPLKLTTAIDAELIAALEASPGRLVSPERATTQASELRQEGEKTILTADNVIKVAAAGGALSVGGAADQRGLIDQAKDGLAHFGTIREIGDAVLDAAQWVFQKWWLPVLLLCAYIAYKQYDIIKKRVDDHRTGKNVEF